MLRTKAAVLHAPGEPLRIEEVTVESPRQGEALIEIAASGLCHTDMTTFDGSNPSCVYPAILGHEGAGRVIQVGDGVSELRPGDHVIPLYGPECGTCEMCKSGRTNLCWTIKATRDKGVMPDGTSRFDLNGLPVHHFMGTSTFSRLTVVPEIALARIEADVSLVEVCLLACAVTTGVGAALHDVRPGDRVAVFGLGGVGVNVIQGARIAGASQIVGVDPVAAKSSLAEQLGMTDFVDARIGGRAVVEAVKDSTSGGVDVAFDCSGVLDVMRQALDTCRPGWGTCVLLGVEEPGEELGVPPVYVRYGRTVKGSYFGGVKGRTGLGRFVDLYADGQLNLESLITRRIRLEDINEGFASMQAGQGLRTVIEFE